MKMGCGGRLRPRIRVKYNSVETEEMTIDLSLFWPDYDIMELLMPETKI